MSDASRQSVDKTPAAESSKTSELPKTHFPPDHPLEVLRQALREAHKARFSYESITQLCRRIRPDFQLTGKAVRNFINADSKTMEEENRKVLAAFWIDSAIGRALRSFNISTSPKFTEVVGFLASGRASLDSKRTVTGHYFMYHGSYLRPDRYVVRVIDVESVDNNTFVVTDSINDALSLGPGVLTAYGALVFVRDHPQILLSADENKVGMCVFIANESSPRAGQMTEALGDFIAMTKRDELIHRRALLRYQPGGDSAEMIAQSGIFTLQQLNEAQRKHHLAAFETLASHEPATIFPDPILNFPTK